jgi:hypothetical protein
VSKKDSDKQNGDGQKNEQEVSAGFFRHPEEEHERNCDDDQLAKIIGVVYGSQAAEPVEPVAVVAGHGEEIGMFGVPADEIDSAGVLREGRASIGDSMKEIECSVGQDKEADEEIGRAQA